MPEVALRASSIIWEEVALRVLCDKYEEVKNCLNWVLLVFELMREGGCVWGWKCGVKFIQQKWDDAV